MNNEQLAAYRKLLEEAVESALEACSPVTVRWNYENGLILGAVYKASKKYFANRYDKRVRELVDVLVGPDGTIRGYRQEEFNLDQINAGKIVFDIWQDSGDVRYKKALDSLMAQLADHPRTDTGSFWHKKIYPWQVWLDGLYMFGPFYARYAAEFSRPELFRDLCSQLFCARNAMRDKSSGFYYHAWDESRTQRWAAPESGLSPHLWGRAVGWLSMALIDILDFLPADYPEREEVVAMFRGLMRAAVAAQDESGLWFQILDRAGQKGNYLEESVSSMFAYSLYKGIAKELLPGAEFGMAADKALEGIVRRFVSRDASGRLHVNGICKVAGLGGAPYRDGSFAYYIGEPVVSDDYKGTGPFILALCEALG
ncbi:MAG TPA: glycoside hydrolase family 88 protein [Rectinemataceae bacterium]|nr:glycoside hydrolase family 88 protein [Rectinemataceae bacterium]